MTEAMRHIRSILLFAAIAALLAACSAKTAEQTVPDPDELSTLDAAFTIDPAAPAANLETTLAAELTGTKAAKRTKVQFEVSKNKDEQGELITAKPASDRPELFTAVYTFRQSGEYFIQIHINTPSVHKIIRKQIEIKG